MNSFGVAFKFKLDVAGVQAVLTALQQYLLRAGPVNPNVSVGYETDYAIYVHENLQAAHKVGQAKFLEEPARKMVQQLTEEVRDRLREGRTLSAALWQAGRRLQWASMHLVPVDTGLLKSTVFTKLDREDVG